MTVDEILQALNEDRVVPRQDVTSEQQATRVWSAGWNMPGYAPDCPYAIFATKREALAYLWDEWLSVTERSRPPRGYRKTEDCPPEHDGYIYDIVPMFLEELL